MTAPHPGTIGPYRPLTELGRGGMGTVHLAMAPDGRLVAVKRIHEQLLADVGFRERLRNEVAAGREVSSPHIVPVNDSDLDASVPWLASDFAYGPTLAHVLSTAGQLPADSGRNLALGLTAALKDIHAANLPHSDLKPSHVLLTEAGPKLIDVGIAKAADHSSDPAISDVTPEQTNGPSGYVSPEQANGTTVDPSPASDIFALGTLLVAASTGSNPFDGGDTLQTLYKVANAEPDLSAVPESIRPFVERCLRKDPQERPTPEELLEEFGPLPEAPTPWSPAVRGLIGWQHTEINRLLRSLQPPRHYPTGATVRLGPWSVPLQPSNDRDRAKLAGMITAGVLTLVMLFGLVLTGIAASSTEWSGDSAGSQSRSPENGTSDGSWRPEPDPTTDPIADAEIGDCFEDHGAEDEPELEPASYCDEGTFEAVEVASGTDDSACPSKADYSAVSEQHDIVLCLEYQHELGDAYHALEDECVWGEDSHDSEWDIVDCETGTFEVLEAIDGSEECEDSDYLTNEQKYTVSNKEYLDRRLCLSIQYPDDIGYATVDTCLSVSGPEDERTHEFTECDSANAIVTGRSSTYEDTGLCGNDGWATWTPGEELSDLAYTVCWRYY